MLGRLKTTLILALAAVVFGPATAAEAQDGGRFRVLVPYFEPLEDADDGFGEDVSEELRELLDGMSTHRAISKDDIEDAADDVGVNMDELNCIRTRQLASQMDAPIAVCATYTEQPDETMVVNAAVWNISASESFDVDEFTIGKDDREEAAQRVFQAFDRYNSQVRAAAICADYASSQQWENALRNCNEALEINPDATSVLYRRARIYYEMEDYSTALEELDTVLEQDPVHEDALQLAGYIAATTDQNDLAREYYSQFLELQPGNAQIRMRIAYELAQAGDPVGAMQFLDIGLEVDPDNVDLWEQYGGFAFAAALQVQEAESVRAAEEDSGELSSAAAEYYREAIDAYERVYEEKGEEMGVGQLRNVISAYIQLGQLDDAIAMGERVLETHPQEDRIWLVYADALQRNGQLDDAITALDRVREINPDHPSAALRQGNWLIQAGRIPDAVEILTDVAEGNPQQAEQAGRLIFNEAYQNGYQVEDYAYAIEGLSAAKEIPNLPEELVHQLNFWHGFSLYQATVQEQEPQTLETAEATLPKFRRALELLQDSGEYPESVNVNLSQLTGNANTYIEIQEAIIQRGGVR
ncbi:MAG: tetratricopeptide repeat protein [Gemmatimonadota bacterium]|nr:tetratricopeptide repeat protein [Gemmatimonadota bacterium]